jgi:hypothetical protein
MVDINPGAFLAVAFKRASNDLVFLHVLNSGMEKISIMCEEHVIDIALCRI